MSCPHSKLGRPHINRSPGCAPKNGVRSTEKSPPLVSRTGFCVWLSNALIADDGCSTINHPATGYSPRFVFGIPAMLDICSCIAASCCIFAARSSAICLLTRRPDSGLQRITGTHAHQTRIRIRTPLVRLDLRRVNPRLVKVQLRLSLVVLRDALMILWRSCFSDQSVNLTLAQLLPGSGLLNPGGLSKSAC